jgi:hypothetical protein
MNRRKIMQLLAVAAFGQAAAFGQKEAIMEGKQAVVCDSKPLKCPNGHDTCAAIDLPIAVGNDRYDYPEVSQIRAYHLLRCDVCHVLFTRE